MNFPKLRIGQSKESVLLDFKSVHWFHGSNDSAEWQLEMAKDIAAFANARGGHIVVGATENDEVVNEFIDPKLPKKWEATFRKVIATWLLPEPIVEIELRCLGSSDVEQLVIQVDPSLNTVVVTNPGDDKRRFSIPFRRGAHTIYAPPLQAVEMLNHPHRRLQLRFLEIRALQPEGKLENMQLLEVDPEKGGVTHHNKWGVWEPEADYVLLHNRKDMDEKLVLPYDRVESVYPLNKHRSRWRVLLDGSLLRIQAESHGYGPYKEIVPGNL